MVAVAAAGGRNVLLSVLVLVRETPAAELLCQLLARLAGKCARGDSAAIPENRLARRHVAEILRLALAYLVSNGEKPKQRIARLLTEVDRLQPDVVKVPVVEPPVPHVSPVERGTQRFLRRGRRENGICGLQRQHVASDACQHKEVAAAKLPNVLGSVLNRGLCCVVIRARTFGRSAMSRADRVSDASRSFSKLS